MRASSLVLHALPLTLLLGACGSSDPKAQGLLALQAGEYERAATKLEVALSTRGEESVDYKEVAMGYCSALAHLDALKAKSVFEQLTDRCALNQADYSRFVGQLFKAGQFAPAVELMDQALQRYPEDPSLEKQDITPIDDVLAPPDDAPTRSFLIALKERALAKARRGQDSEQLQQLQSLGYLGGGD